MPNKPNTRPPEIFRPLLWSYDFPKVDAERNKNAIIINALNYGDLKHWRWLIRHYGKNQVRKIIESAPVTEFRPQVRPLLALVFGAHRFNYAPRGTRRKT